MRYSPTIVEDVLQQWTSIDPVTGKLVVDFGKLTPESMASFYILPGVVLTALAEAAETSLITPLQIDDAAELRGRDLIDIFNSILAGWAFVIDDSSPWADKAPISDLLRAMCNYLVLIRLLEEYLESGSLSARFVLEGTIQAPLTEIEKHPLEYFCTTSVAHWWNATLLWFTWYVEACVSALEGGEIQVEELPLPLCPEFSEEHAGTEDDGVLSWHLGVHYPQQDHYEMWLSIPEGSDRPAEIYVHLRNEDDPFGVLAGILMWLEEFIAKLSHEVAAAHAEFIRAPHHLDLKAAAAWFKRLMRDVEKLEFSFDLVGFRRTLLSLGQEVDHPEAEDISKGYAKRFKKGLSPAIRKTIQRASTQIEHIVHATSKVPSEEAAQAALRFMSANPGLCSLLTPDMAKKALRNPREANHRTQALREELAVDVVKQIHGRSIPKDTALKVLKNK